MISEPQLMAENASALQMEKMALNEIRETTINPDVSTMTSLVNGNLYEIYEISPQTFSSGVDLLKTGTSLIEFRAPFQSRPMMHTKSYIRTCITFTNPNNDRWVAIHVHCHKSLFRDIEFIGLGVGGKEFVRKENNVLDEIAPSLIPLLNNRDIGDNDRTTNNENFHRAKKYGNVKVVTSYTAANTINLSPEDASYMRDIILIPPLGIKTVYYNHYLSEIAQGIFNSSEPQLYIPMAESVLRLYTNNTYTPVSVVGAAGQFVNTLNCFEVYTLTVGGVQNSPAGGPLNAVPTGVGAVDTTTMTFSNTAVNRFLPTATNFITFANDATYGLTTANHLQGAAMVNGGIVTGVLTSCVWCIPRLTYPDPMQSAIINKYVNDGKSLTYPVIKRIYVGSSTGTNFNYSQYFNLSDLKNLKHIIIGVKRPFGNTYLYRNQYTKPSFQYSTDDILSADLSLNGYSYQYGGNTIFNDLNTYQFAAQAGAGAFVSTPLRSKNSVFINNYRKSYEKYFVEPGYSENVSLTNIRDEFGRGFQDTAGLIIWDWKNEYDGKIDKVRLTDDASHDNNIEYKGVTDNKNYQLTCSLNLGLNYPASVFGNAFGAFNGVTGAPFAIALPAGYSWTIEIFVIGMRTVYFKGGQCWFDYENSYNSA